MKARLDRHRWPYRPNHLPVLQKLPHTSSEMIHLSEHTASEKQPCRVSRRILMSQDEPTLDAIFQKFVSAYFQANLEDRVRVASHLRDWGEQQETVSGIPHHGS